MRLIGGNKTFPLPPPRPVMLIVLSRGGRLVEICHRALQSLCQLKDQISHQARDQYTLIQHVW